MKELICFALGLALGAAMMKRNQTIDELRKELDREKSRQRPAESAATT